jgi:hypothetical protein
MAGALHRVAMGMVVVAVGMGAAACGSSGSSTATTAAGATATSGTGPAGSPGAGGLSLARLGSLTDYSFTSTAGNDGSTITVTGEVHDPTDWETHSASPAVTNYDVGGRGYAVAIGQVTPVTLKTPEGLTHLDGETTYAKALIGYTHVTGIRITTGGHCSVAGVRGTTYDVKSPGADATLLVETATACVADGSGALLSFASGVPGGSAASAVHITGATTSFTVDAVGGTGPIAAPSGSPTTTVATLPSDAGGARGLPAGFPAQVPAPPGRILAGTELSPTKWYVELTETGATAEAQYVQALQGKGFTVVDTSNTAAGDITTLSDGSLQVLAEQMSLPGQGVVMTVTVSTAG